MDLFIYFALPLSTILLSIVLQKVLKCPILVAITFLAVGLIISFTVYSENLANAIIATIIYSIIALITAYIVKIICCLYRRIGNFTNNRGEDEILKNKEYSQYDDIDCNSNCNSWHTICRENRNMITNGENKENVTYSMPINSENINYNTSRNNYTSRLGRMCYYGRR